MAEQYSATWKIGQVEHWLSLLGGGALVIFGLARRSLIGFALALLGGDLIYHGLSQQGPHIHQVFGLELPAEPSQAEPIQGKEAIKIQRSVTINRSPEDLYRFWRNPENFPRVFDFIHSVRKSDSTHSHWIAKSPAGLAIEWDSAITHEIPNQLISWQSLEGSGISSIGSVSFVRSPNAKGTRVNVTLEYYLDPGPIGEEFAELLGGIPSQTVREQLGRLKLLLERDTVNPIRSSLRTLWESR